MRRGLSAHWHQTKGDSDISNLKRQLRRINNTLHRTALAWCHIIRIRKRTTDPNYWSSDTAYWRHLCQSFPKKPREIWVTWWHSSHLLKSDIPFTCHSYTTSTSESSSFCAHINNVFGFGFLLAYIASLGFLDKHINTCITYNMSTVTHHYKAYRVSVKCWWLHHVYPSIPENFTALFNVLRHAGHWHLLLLPSSCWNLTSINDFKLSQSRWAPFSE